MTMRVLFTTPGDVGEDEWGGTIPVGDGSEVEAACLAWHPTDVRQVLDGDKNGVIGAVRMIVPADTDISEVCTVTEITDRIGRVVFAGPMRVTAVTHRTGHLAVMLRTARANRTGA